MFLFTRDHVARAHGSVMILAAFADADAAPRDQREAPPIVRKPEMRLDSGRLARIGAYAKMCVERVGIHDLARIHLPVGIPDRLEIAKGLDHLRAEHAREQLAARLAIPVFT